MLVPAVSTVRLCSDLNSYQLSIKIIQTSPDSLSKAEQFSETLLTAVILKRKIKEASKVAVL